ncbi:MAG: hypothetical protein G01um101438_460 [Parcubacteria group bacterium Gr01-1014_38]|nr:MAG: hypothetical protein G01um101438_460 [Parcubacteria group bacterium Gr01-1014_38]
MKPPKVTLPHPAKVAASHALRDLDFTVVQIATALGFSERSTARYLKEPTPEEWQSFASQIKKLVLLKEEEIAAKTLGLIEEKLPKASFYQLVGLYKTIRDGQRAGPGQGLAIQQVGGDLKVEFVRRTEPGSQS